MERFVRLVVAGGLALVVGLWLTVPFTPGSPAWFGGVTLAVLGCVALAVGIRTELTVGPLVGE